MYLQLDATVQVKHDRYSSNRTQFCTVYWVASISNILNLTWNVKMQIEKFCKFSVSAFWNIPFRNPSRQASRRALQWLACRWRQAYWMLPVRTLVVVGGTPEGVANNALCADGIDAEARQLRVPRAPLEFAQTSHCRSHARHFFRLLCSRSWIDARAESETCNDGW